MLWSIGIFIAGASTTSILLDHLLPKLVFLAGNVELGNGSTAIDSVRMRYDGTAYTPRPYHTWNQPVGATTLQVSLKDGTVFQVITPSSSDRSSYTVVLPASMAQTQSGGRLDEWALERHLASLHVNVRDADIQAAIALIFAEISSISPGTHPSSQYPGSAITPSRRLFSSYGRGGPSGGPQVGWPRTPQWMGGVFALGWLIVWSVGVLRIVRGRRS